MSEPAYYLEPSQNAGRDFMQRGITGSVIMLNLLRFRAIADYTAHPALAPESPISGEAAFARYIEHSLPHLHASGGEIMVLGEGGPWLIGPEEERWDLAMIIRQRSVESFIAFVSHAPYLAGLGHRTAAIADSRLLPISQLPIPLMRNG